MKTFKQGLFILLCLLACLVTAGHGAAAQEIATDEESPSPMTHRIGMDFGFDSSNSSSTTLSYGYSRKDLRIYVSGGASKSEPLASEASSTSGLIGVASSEDAFFTYGGELSTWGLNGELKHNSLRIPLGFNWSHWTLLVAPSGGNLKFENLGLLGRRERTVKANSLELAVDYLGLENWRFGITAIGYNYSEDLTILSNQRFAQFFTETTLSLSGSLQKSRSAIDITYLLPTADLTVRVGQATNAVDESVTAFLELDGYWEINQHLGVNLMFGSAKVRDYGLTPVSNQDDDGFGYGAMGFSYKFN